MNYLEFYQKINISKKIKQLEKKYKNKRIIIYGAGIMSSILFKNYNLSNLNIVGIADRKFTGRQGETFEGYPAFSPDELTNLDYDVVLVLVKNLVKIAEYIKYELLLDTKNEDAKVDLFINFSLFDYLKVLICE